MRRREIIFALLLAAVFLLAAGFFFFTSSFFLTRMVVPWIARSTDCPMAVEQADYRLFSNRLILYGFRLGRADAPFLTVRRARGTVQWKNLIRGIMDFDDVELAGAELNICRDASGNWCRYELGLDVPENDADGSAGEDSPPVQVRIPRCRVEDLRVNVILRDGQRDMAWHFTGISGKMADFRNGGRMMINCFSPFRVTGRGGTEFSGRVEWNGELLLDEYLVFAGLRGGFNIGVSDGSIDRRGIGASAVRCMVDVCRGERGAWDFRNFRLIQQKRNLVGSLVEFSGTTPDADGEYQLDFQRLLLSGELLSLLTDMGCGIRPGGMTVDGQGRLAGARNGVSADFICRISRPAGPAYFGEEKVDLPDFQLQTEQNLQADLHSRKLDFRKVRVLLSSGGRQVLEVRKDPETSAVSARIKDLDLKLLQFLMPDMQQFGISGGSVSGEVHWAKDWGANAISGRTELRFAQTSLHAGAWSPEVFDAVVAGQFKLPVSGGALKVESFRLDAEREGSVFLHFGASGSLPLPDGKAELAWQAEGDAVRLLEMFRTSLSAETTAVLRQFAPVRAAGSGKWDFSPEGVTLREHRVELAGRDKSSVRLALDKRDLLWKDPLRQPWKIRWQAACPAVLLPLWPSVHFSGGDFSGSGELGIQRGAAGGAVHGEVQWQDLAGRLYGNPFERFSGGVEFSLSRDGRGVCNLSRSSLYGRVAGKPALRLECSGACVPSTGAFQADVRVRYANEHWLDILLPGRFRSGQLSGRSRIHGDLRKTDWVLNGFFAVDKLRSPGAARAVDGRLQYEFHRRGKALEMPFCNLRLNSGSKVLADLQLQFSVPAAEEQPVKIRFSGAPLDLSSLYAQVSAPSSSAGTRSLAESPDIAPAARERVVLYAGERLKEVQLDLRDMSWGGSQRFALKGDIVLQKNRVTARNMVLDGGGGQLEWGADGMDFPAGMMLAVHGKVGKPFALNPFVSLFFPESGLDGVVESGEWSLNFQRLFTARWGADLQGSSRFRLKNVELPVNAANGPLSRLLLLPVETVVRAEQLIPETWDVRKHFKTLWEHKFSAQSPFSLLKFRSGELVLTASHGDLRIKQMQFTGDPLARLEAAGKMRLISPFELELDSTVLLCGVQAKLPVRGFLSSPQVAAWQLFSQLPGSTLSGWMDIFSPFNEDGASAEVPFISPFIRLIRDVAGFQE